MLLIVVVEAATALIADIFCAESFPPTAFAVYELPRKNASKNAETEGHGTLSSVT